MRAHGLFFGSRRKWLALTALVIAGAAGVAIFWRNAVSEETLVATVRRGELVATLTTTGALKPIRSITYRSPVPGRELEIRELVPEGARVAADDVLVQLDTTELEGDLERARQEFRQAQIDLQVVEGEWEEASNALQDVSEGERALSVDESRAGLQRSEKKVERLRQELSHLEPLLARGFITRDELATTSARLEEAEDELALARKRSAVIVQVTHPRDQKRAALQVERKASQLGLTRARVDDVRARVELLARLIEESTIRARDSGLVVYEEFLNVLPRRKIRIGDRVFATQGLVTIPEIDRMLVEGSVGEADVHRLRIGQPARVRVEAFPDVALTGTVSRVGALASASAARPIDDKRFDLVVELDSTTVGLRPEMTARADIVVSERKGVLIVPVNAVFRRHGSYVAYVRGPGGVTQRSIELGASNDRLVEVVSGLDEQEQVALIEPSDAAADARTTSADATQTR
ncbi:MAG: efflux RND transporter periplasmic adaptor subunit [Vicinamibacterales bacterium]